MTAWWRRTSRRGRLRAVVLLLVFVAFQVVRVPARATGGAVSIDDVSVAEPAVGSRAVVFTVTLARTDATHLVVNYATVDGTAVAGQDYVAAQGSLDFGTTGTTRTVRVPVLGDGLSEVDETFGVRLTNTSPELIGTATITDGDFVPRLSIGDARVSESSGTPAANFAVTLSEPSGKPVSVGYATANGSGAGGAAAPGDFAATSGTVTFDPGQRVRTVAVPVVDDDIDEGGETFTITLSGASQATIAQPTGAGTIVDDDGAPALSVSDATATEANTGPTPMTFKVTLDRPSSQNVTFRVQTIDGTGSNGANAPDDYEALASSPRQITAGATSVEIAVPVTGDLTHEAGEAFGLVLSAEANATVAKPMGTGTITDNDMGPDVTVADAKAAEGTLVGPSLEFKITLSAPPGKDVTLNYATADGTAMASATAPDEPDYKPASADVVFHAGDVEKTVTVLVNHDALAEGDETVLLTVTSVAEGIGIARASATGTIGNDDGPPDELSVSDPSFSENDTGMAGHLFTVTRTKRTAGIVSTVVVRYATADGTATPGADYTPRTGVLVFSGSATTQTVSVSVAGDVLDEDDEHFTVTLSSPTNAVLVKGTGTATILDDDAPPVVSAAPVTVSEGNTATSTGLVGVALSAPSSKPVTVGYTVGGGTATVDDYRADMPEGTLTFAPGETARTVSFSVIGDPVDEDDETFVMTLSNASNADLAAPGGVPGRTEVTIADDDAAPAASIGDDTINETGAATPLAFTVSLDHVSGRAVTVTVETADGTAVAPGDYGAVHGRAVTIPAGVRAGTVPVTVADDGGSTPDAPSETFTVTLSSPVNATLAAGIATGTIVDNDGPATLSVVGDTVPEGTGGSNTTSAVFVVTLSKELPQDVTVDYATVDGPAPGGAQHPGDYAHTTGTLRFPAGKTTGTVAVTVVADNADEPDETFTLELVANPTNASLDPAGSAAPATIVDDDGPTISVADIAVPEGDSSTANAVFTVALKGPSVQPVTVAYATGSGTAAGGADYTTTSGTLTFAAGDSAATVAVPVAGDTINEGDEDFFLTLAGATSAAIADPVGRALITNDDLSQLDIADANIVEGDSGTANLAFTVTLSPPSTSPVTVSFASRDTTAAAGQDYGAVSGGLTFNPGDTTRTVVAPVSGDTTDSLNETFAVTLSAASVTARLGQAVAAGTIIDDEAVPDLVSPDATVTEKTQEDTSAVFPVRLSGPRAFTVTVHYETVAGTASSGVDFTPVSGDLTFAPGDEVKRVPVTVMGDSRAEADETIRLRFSAAGSSQGASGVSPGNIGLDPDAVATIVDDDKPGYLLAATDGGIFTFGGAGFFGSTGNITLNQPIVGLAPHPSGRGYWLVATDGGIFSFGEAKFLGSRGAAKLNKPIVGMASTPSGQGYWLVATDGGIFSFGDAAFFGSTGAITLNKPIVGMGSTPSGQGYWLVATDGGIFSFGDAAFFGSTGARRLNKPVVGMVSTPGGKGYWLVAIDGGIFSFGDATFLGSTGGLRLNRPAVGMSTL
ncbi:MAG TPA: Calx-beta domain-containing protein [Acidimicrobiia bacterium]|nr:Calx-beta domain-containing protein [Acidimicrobiia bacterium]